jgi:hypothetical protein
VCGRGPGTIPSESAQRGAVALGSTSLTQGPQRQHSGAFHRGSWPSWRDGPVHVRAGLVARSQGGRGSRQGTSPGVGNWKNMELSGRVGAKAPST